MPKTRFSFAAATLALASISLASLSLASVPASAQELAAKAGHYSVTKTLVGELLDDPAAAAVLKKMIPTIYANDQFQQAGRSLTLQAIQQYEPDALSDENLAKIQAELDKLPAKG